MSETVTESKPLRVPTAAELGIDVDTLRKKYAEEREKRLRADGNRQYQVPPKSPAFSTIRIFVIPAF